MLSRLSTPGIRKSVVDLLVTAKGKYLIELLAAQDKKAMQFYNRLDSNAIKKIHNLHPKANHSILSWATGELDSEAKTRQRLLKLQSKLE